MAKDKILHFLAGLAIAAIAGTMFGWPVGLFAGFAAGVMKEVADKLGDGTPDWRDAFATAGGAAIGAAGVALMVVA